MTTIIVLSMALCWIAVSISVDRRKRGTLQTLSQATEKADAIRQSMDDQFKRLSAILDARVPTGRGSKRSSAALMKILETTIYTKRRITLYYDPERDIVVKHFESPQFLATGLDLAPAELDIAFDFKAITSLDDLTAGIRKSISK